jgi:hypothetical protein
MRTDQLLAVLIADRAAGRQPIGRALGLALAAGGALSLVPFLLTLGVRPDIGPALATWRFDLKIVTILLGLGLAVAVCRDCARPDAPRHPMRRLLLLLGVVVAAVATELALTPAASWPRRLVGSNSMICLSAIPALSVAPLVAVLVVLRRAAPASPTLAGMAAGLVAAFSGASLYAFHCFDDSPLFVATWYTAAAIPVVALGVVVGRRWLRW